MIETKTSIELSDVESIEFECNVCHARVAYPAKSYESAPISCAACKGTDRQQWLIPGSEDYSKLIVLGEAIRLFSGMHKPKGFTLRLHLNQTKETSSQ